MQSAGICHGCWMPASACAANSFTNTTTPPSVFAIETKTSATTSSALRSSLAKRT